MGHQRFTTATSLVGTCGKTILNLAQTVDAP
jgi:hypothetical protein